MSLLSDIEIEKHMKYGSIVISPFKRERLNASSYDLELGPFFYRYESIVGRDPSKLEEGEGFSFVDARDQGGLWIDSQERILGHTVEFAGGTTGCDDDGRERTVTTEMSATSTAGRHGISACLCAKLGSPSYINRWTLEIINHGPSPIWLPVGSIICQLSFLEITTPGKKSTDKAGSYQEEESLKEIEDNWKPSSMLPKKLKVSDTWRGIFISPERGQDEE